MKNSGTSGRWTAVTACLWTTLSLAGLLCGCAGYRLGSTLPPDIRSIYIPTFKNESGEPEAEVTATRATIEEFQKDGSLTVAGQPQAADVILEATLTSIKLEPVRYEEDDPKAAGEYRLWMSADVVLRRRGAAEAMMTRRLSGDRKFVPSGDLSSGKRTVMPEAAADLAHDIVEAVVEAW